MILRKPYGFLIKHFKLIHLVLTAIYIYLAIKVSNLLKYYNNYIAGTESKLNAIKHVNSFYLVAIIASIIICGTIFALMRYKKKPKLLYIILIAVYIVVAIIVNYSYGGLQIIYISKISAKDLRLYRDLLRIVILFQYITIFFTLIRGLGFDIKKFNFKEDINELNLEVTDDEEIELTINNTEGLERKGRRQLREIRYYYLENKMLINTVAGIVAAIIIFVIIINVSFLNREFKEGEEISTDKYSFTVQKSYLTNKSYDGSVITNEDSIFLIANIAISSKIGRTELNTANMLVKTESGSYKIVPKYASSFKDIGVGYKNQAISYQRNFLFLYCIDKKDINKKIQIIYAGTKKIRLKPINLDDSSKETTYKLGETIDLSQTVIGSGKFSINKYAVQNTFAYNYEYEINGKKYHSRINLTSPYKTLLYLNPTFQTNRDLSLYEFITNYGKIKYKVNDVEYINATPIDKTPNSERNKLYLEVDKQMDNASNIWIEFNIRSKKIIYTLK